VTGISRESETVISVHLTDPGGGSVPAALPGQFLTLRLHPDPARRPLLRSYSLSGPPGARDYRISVKREEHGAASQFLHTRVQAGDLLEAAAPRGTFTLRPGQEPVLLISAGVGATPVLARRPHPPAGQPGSGPVVTFARSDLNAPWDPGYASLLEFAEACDVPVRWSCRAGVCHTCETAVISGTVGYAPAPVDDPADGSVLICCSQPRDDLVLDL
jgi:ferredoxin